MTQRIAGGRHEEMFTVVILWDCIEITIYKSID